MQKEIHALSNHGAGVVCIHENKVLLVQLNYSSNKGRWILPGGMMEKNESPSEAALRELEEETSLHADITSCLGVRFRTHIGEDRPNNSYWVFKVELEKNQDLEKLAWPAEELQDVRFWPLEQIKNHPDITLHTQKYIQYALEKPPVAIEEFPSRYKDTFYAFQD